MSDPSIPIALTIAGSDSGGGAGIQADLKTFHAFGVYGTSAVTAVTAQNTIGVHSIHTVPIDTVVAQIDAVANDLRPDALKTGMLAPARLVNTVAEVIRRHRLEKLVVDEGWRRIFDIEERREFDFLEGDPSFERLMAIMRSDLELQLERVREIARNGELDPVQP